jgi:hypothetical protein
MKLVLETGAIIYPAFVFGASDMLDQLVYVDKDPQSSTSTASLSKHVNAINSNTILDCFGTITESLSRKVGGGLTLFYGQYFLPWPYNPKLTMVMDNPIYPIEEDATMKNACDEKRTCPRADNLTTEQVEELMERYVEALHNLFNRNPDSGT